MASNEFRFGVGEPSGRRSPSWKIVWEDTGDIYMIHREAKDGFKASFHRDGRSHVAIHKANWQSEGDTPGLDKPSRYYAKWGSRFTIEGTEERADALFHLAVASQDLRYYGTLGKQEGDNIRWFTDPGEGMQREITLLRSPICGDGVFPRHQINKIDQAYWLDKRDVRLWIMGYARPVTRLTNERALVRAIRRKSEAARRQMDDIADDWTDFVGITSDEGMPGIRTFSGRSIRGMMSPALLL